MDNSNDQFQIMTNININGNNSEKDILNKQPQQNENSLHNKSFISLFKSDSPNGRIKIINNNKNKDDKTNKSNNTLLLQEKLKNLFLEREKAKFIYNKQSIPEQLKYNSDDEESNISKDIKNNNQNINIIKEKENKEMIESKSFRNYNNCLDDENKK